MNKGGDESGSHWVRRTVLVTFCVLLLGALGVVFTRVIAARVPEQRATLEKLITDRTGLAVRFDNVHFAWNLDGTSAVFERVELTDPEARTRARRRAGAARRVRHLGLPAPPPVLAGPRHAVVAGHRDHRRPDDPGQRRRRARGGKPQRAAAAKTKPRWCAASRRGPSSCRMAASKSKVRACTCCVAAIAPRAHTFTLSQAVVSRGASSFNAFGTMLLSQDVGQSLFLSAKLEGLGAGHRVSRAICA